MQTIALLRSTIGVIISLIGLVAAIYFIKRLASVLQERRWKNKIKVRQVLDEIDWGIDEPCLN